MAQSEHHDLKSCVQERGMLTGKNEGFGLHKKIIFLCDSYVVSISLLSLSLYIYTRICQRVKGQRLELEGLAQLKLNYGCWRGRVESVSHWYKDLITIGGEKKSGLACMHCFMDVEGSYIMNNTPHYKIEVPVNSRLPRVGRSY